MISRPEPCEEEADPDPFWKVGKDAYDDPGDALIPRSGGFITDFIYSLRGTEVPTTYGIWGALWMLACTIKREGWLAWGEENLFPNLYIILIGTAGLVKKTTLILRSSGILQRMPDYIENKSFREVKRITIVKNKATPEAILVAMNKMGNIVMRDDSGNVIRKNDGEVLTVPRSSELALVIPEMSVLFNKQSYNESLVQNLLDLYDSHEDGWDWSTKGEGKRVLKNLCTSMLAGTTPTGFQEALPSAALGDGFISRSLLIHEISTTRCFPVPLISPDAPTKKELSKRLAWIAMHSQGRVEFLPKAREAYNDWYRINHKKAQENPELAGVIGRMPTIVLKVSLLISCHRYDHGGERITIDESDFQDARRIVGAAYRTAPQLMGELRGSDMQKSIARMRNYFRRKYQETGTIEWSRSDLLRNTHINADDANIVFRHLMQEGSIDVYQDGEKTNIVRPKRSQSYVWLPGDK